MRAMELATTERRADEEAENGEVLVGHVLAGLYPVVRFIGQGGMGAVYEVARFDGAAAAKVLAKGDKPDKNLFRRFAREAKAAAEIDHPHVTKTFELAHDDELGAPFLLMELLVGKDLSQVLEEQSPLPPEVTVRIGLQAARGLAAAHEKGIVHRDVKPANLFVHTPSSGDLTVKVCDFGIAKLIEDRTPKDASDLTKSGGLIGSPLYMSPEQAQSAKDLDARTDVWSLCASLYEALSGRRMWQEYDALGEIIVAICTKPAPPLARVAPWVPRAIADVIHKGLRIDKAERWQTMAALVDALTPLVGRTERITSADLVALPAAARKPVVASSSTVTSADTLDVPVSDARSSRRGLAGPQRLGLVAAALAGIGVVGYFGLRSSTTESPSRPEPAPVQAASTTATSATSSPTAPAAATPTEIVSTAPPKLDASVLGSVAVDAPSASVTASAKAQGGSASARVRPAAPSATSARTTPATTAPPPTTTTGGPTREEWK